MPIALALLLGCGTTETPEAAEDPVEAPPPVPAPRHVTLFGAIPDDQFGGSPPPAPLVELGRKLFSDQRLSADRSRSCASCHPLDRYGTTDIPSVSLAEGTVPGRNPPSVYNAGMQFALHWDASQPSLEAQAQHALIDPVQSGFADAAAVTAALGSMSDYAAPFAAAFPDSPDRRSLAQAGQALAAFERSLTTPHSRIDRYLAGDKEALTGEEMEGFERFVELGCNSCHSGALFGGGQVQRLGAVEPYDTPDLGRQAVTDREADRHLFRVPSLRNVAETGPWLHDGSVDDLAEMVRRMAKHQLGMETSDADVTKIVGFLQTLTGDLPSTEPTPPPQ
ncbi:MAG: cytochrome c peroxidase [Myxococcota bacterium]